ncbi:MAG TPA: HD-GYP domain-containing protein [Solirubrobacteraceae bacterium]|nr:HD-GYP domain-containing protein [Solirubrobacteraceae bacterium]
MRLVRITDLLEDARLARDILTGKDAAPLLRAGVTLNDRFIEHLTRAGIRAVWVEDRYSQGIDPEPAIGEQTRALATRVLVALHEEARQAAFARRALDPEATEDLSEAVDAILEEIEDSDGKALVLADLCGPDAYAIQHSIDVTALGLLIGRALILEHGWLDYKGERHDDRHEERLFRLGVGLLLSDIGKLAIPEAIINKPGKLSEEEWETVQTHPKAGVKLIRDTPAWCPLVQACVLRHHERWDGSGYPEGKGGTEIHEMARIAAVADTFDAITSERPYAPAKPVHAGVQAILAGAGTQFDPVICEVFSRRVAPFPPGIEVELVDGRRAVVVSVSEYQLDRPVLRVIGGPDAPIDIDSSQDRSIQIAGWTPVQVGGAAEAA